MSIDTIIGIVGGAIVGLIITHAYYRIQKRRRELYWSEDSTILIKGYSSLFAKLQIQYGDEKIENLTVSKIAFWNNGNETIDRKDVAIPICILAAEATKILDFRVIKASTAGNRIEVLAFDQEPDSVVVLRFDYLDPQQGAVIQVIHTGVSVWPLWVNGQVKGVKRIEHKSKRPDIFSQIARIFLYFYGVMMSVLVGAYVYNSVFRGIPARADWVVWFLGVLWILVLVALFFDFRERRNTAKIPKDLSVFEQDDIGIKRR